MLYHNLFRFLLLVSDLYGQSCDNGSIQCPIRSVEEAEGGGGTKIKSYENRRSKKTEAFEKKRHTEKTK